jgi:hypothetical protein
MSSRNRNRCTFTRDLPQLDFHKPLQAGPASVVLGGGVPSWPGSDSGGTPPHSMRCRDLARPLRIREAFGVRQLAGAVEVRGGARRPRTPLRPSTNDRMGCSPEDIAHSRAGFHPGPLVTIRWRARFHPGQGTPRKASFIGRSGMRPSKAGQRGSHPSIWRNGRFQAESSAARCLCRVGFHPGLCHTAGGTPPHSMRCRDLARPLRIREAFGVRQLAGAVEVRGGARRPTAPRLRYTYDRSF